MKILANTILGQLYNWLSFLPRFCVWKNTYELHRLSVSKEAYKAQATIKNEESLKLRSNVRYNQLLFHWEWKSKMRKLKSILYYPSLSALLVEFYKGMYIHTVTGKGTKTLMKILPTISLFVHGFWVFVYFSHSDSTLPIFPTTQFNRSEGITVIL